MLKRIIQSVAATVLMGSAAFAGDIAGTYSAQTARGPLVVELHHDADHLAGVVRLGETNMPLIAHEVADEKGHVIYGDYELQGHQFHFGGVLKDDSHLMFEAAGTTVQLDKTSPLASAPLIPTPETPVASTPVQTPVELRQGKVFQFLQPDGWSVSEKPNSCQLIAPDGITRVTASVYIRPGKSTPKATFDELYAYLPKCGCTNVRIVMENAIKDEPGVAARAYGLAYEVKGMPMRAMVLVRISNKEQTYLGHVECIEAPDKTFNQTAELSLKVVESMRPIKFDQLISMQKQIQATVEQRTAGQLPQS